MALDIRTVEYYNVTVDGHVGEGAKLLAVFADVGISWLAFKAVPLESMRTRFTLFPDDSSKMDQVAKNAGLSLEGPYTALFIQGNDESGALADIYENLSQADIKVYEASGIANINGAYGVILYVKQEECERALAALKM